MNGWWYALSANSVSSGSSYMSASKIFVIVLLGLLLVSSTAEARRVCYGSGKGGGYQHAHCVNVPGVLCN